MAHESAQRRFIEHMHEVALRVAAQRARPHFPHADHAVGAGRSEILAIGTELQRPHGLSAG